MTIFDRSTPEARAKRPPLVVEEVTDPAEIARIRTHHEQMRRNSAWLQSHWADVLPQARGRFLAVACQEPFIADTPEEAWAMARVAHPEDRGALLQYIRPE